MISRISGFLAIALCLFAVAFQQAPAQPAGPVVREIAVEYVGPPAISRDRVLANIATQVGQPYSERLAEEDIRALYATGGVSNARIFAEPLGDGVKVTVLLQGRPVIEEIVIEGAEFVPVARIRREIGSKVGEVLSEERLEDDRQKILALYEARNFSEVDVQYRIVELPGTNRSRVVFSINEGPRMVVRRITFEGNDSILARDLRRAMKTRPWNVLSFINKSGRLVPAQIEEDRAALRALYQNRGFADAEIVDIRTEPLGGDGVGLVVVINEGPIYRVNTVRLEGVNIVPQDEVRSRLQMLDGSLFTPKGMGDDLRALRDFYGSRGYVDMMAMPEILPVGPGSVDVVYNVDEGIQSFVNLVNIQGNTRTQDRVIRRELAVRPGDVFDTTLVDVSRKRLENLNYFSRVDMAPSQTIVPGRKDLNVIVEEKRTGSFNFGVGFSTIDSLVGFAELTQSNFDLFNFPRFTGGGQRLRIRGQYGIQRSDFVISLTEPWFLGYRLAVGVEGYYREASFLSTVYDQSNLGFAIQARKQLWRALSARGEYRLEQVRIFNVDEDDVGIQIQEAEGNYVKSGFEGALIWDTRDNLFLTRRGELVNFTAFISGGGLGGDVQAYGLSLEASKYIALPFDFIFLVKGQLAVVDGWGGSQNTDEYGNGVPIFDRLYLGGANNLRGFNFREVGPVDSKDNPIG
ncbi:MAG: outer membrane protein assembly factor BamA, partial [Terrimicrobiaceae bacterium]|nr:outer membrane protein assembly factor BamA [Terrimicrobiaceae bacterium]